MRAHERLLEVRSLLGTAVGAVVLFSQAACAGSDSVKQCQVEKMQSARNRADCLADERITKVNGKTPDFAICEAAFDKALASAEAAAAKKDVACRFLDNGDGTISDLNTLLMWEKKDDGNDVHNKNSRMPWITAMSGWVSWLNGFGECGSPDCPSPQTGFAGYTDWRLPTLAELRTIFKGGPECSAGAGCVDPVFDSGCTDGCTVTSCSCTARANYWSSTTKKDAVQDALLLNFKTGSAGNLEKDGHVFVRAVRGGR